MVRGRRPTLGAIATPAPAPPGRARRLQPVATCLRERLSLRFKSWASSCYVGAPFKSRRRHTASPLGQAISSDVGIRTAACHARAQCCDALEGEPRREEWHVRPGRAYAADHLRAGPATCGPGRMTHRRSAKTAAFGCSTHRRSSPASTGGPLPFENRTPLSRLGRSTQAGRLRVRPARGRCRA